jgi:diacylglycerol kinase (ATP)
MSEPTPAYPSRLDARSRGTGHGTPVVILNPACNQGRAGRLRKLLEQALGGGRGELVLTAAVHDAEHLAREAALAGRDIVAVGGDGTIAEVGNGILASGARVALGIVPAGTGNDYAYETLRLPREPLRALELALAGRPVAMDAGQVNERYFLNALGVGIDANIAAAAESLKRIPFLRGQTLYWAASLRELLFHYDQCPLLTIAWDDAPAENELFALAAVSIGPTYGGGFQINPGADPRDGYFELCMLTKPPLARALRLLPMVEKGKHLNQPEAHHVRVQRVTMAAEQEINAHLDGEVIRAQRFTVRILPGALLVRQ